MVGTPNRATLEREEAARAMLARDQEAERLRVAGMAAEMVAARTAGIKLAKDVLSDFMIAFGGLATYYQPFLIRPGPDGQPVRVPNPTGDAAEFKEYGMMAVQAAKDLAQYQSPKMSAVMVGSAMITEIEITGGLPDADYLPAPEQKQIDHVRTIELLAEDDDPLGLRAGSQEGDGGAADAASVPGEGVPDSGEAEGAPVRKAVG